MENRRKRMLAFATGAAVFCLVYTLSSGLWPGLMAHRCVDSQGQRIVLAQFIQRIAREQRVPARREAQMFRQITRAHDSAFRQAARTDAQLSRRTIWNFETKFRDERRRTVRDKINQTRAQEQVIRNDKARFNVAQTKERQSLRATTAQQRREQTLRISREIRRTNIERQRANRERIEEVRDVVRSELQQIREGTRRTPR